MRENRVLKGLKRRKRHERGRYRILSEPSLMSLKSLASFVSLFAVTLPLYHSAADQHIATIPCGKLACCDASLRLIEEDVHAIIVADEFCCLKRLTVAYTHYIFATFALLHSLRRVYPVHLLGEYA